MSNDTQESPSSRPRFYPSVLTQMQIERLKREDEDEHWISGEELYTEGSSDDDEDNQRLTIINPEVCNVENIQSANSIVGLQKPAAVIRSKLSHLGHLKSSQIASCSIQLQEKVKIDDSDPTCSCPIIPIPLSEEKLSSLSSPSLVEKNSAENVEGGATDAVGLNESGENVSDYIDEEKEISWRPKRDDNYEKTLIFEDSIVELRELQFEYHEILDNLSELKTSLTQLSCCSNSANLLKRCNNYNEKKELNENVNENENENENSTDLLETILQLESNKISEVKSTAKEEIIIIEDISFSDENLNRWSETIINTAKIEKEIFKIMKLDSWIEDLYEKVKKSKDETFQEQILNRNELKRLINLKAPESGKLAKNSEKFFKLCSMDIQPTELAQDNESVVYTDNPIFESQEELENLRPSEYEEESRKLRKKKLEEELTIIDKRKDNFIERNKELASCSMGTLAITDEEKKRLKELIEDIDDEKFETEDQISTVNISSSGVSTPYTIDKEADELLKNLTEQLENLNSETYRKAAEDERYTRKEFLAHKEQLVINSLRNLEESGSKIIHPISREEIRKLINEYHIEEEATSSRIFVNGFQNELSNDLNLGTLQDTETSNSASIISESRKISQDVIKELIKEAKTTMPHFQFKYRTESIEEFENKEENDEKPI